METSDHNMRDGSLESIFKAPLWPDDSDFEIDTRRTEDRSILHI